MHVGYDYDGVISSFHAGVDKYLRLNGYEGLKASTTQWDFWKDWGWSNSKFHKFWVDGVRDGIIFATAPFPGAVDAINSVYDAGHKVHIITHRGWKKYPGLAEDLTAACLERDGIRYHSLTFTADKTDVWTDMMVDDKPENYYDLIKAGTDAYLLTRDWNKHIEGAKRVRSVGEFSRKVLEKVDSAQLA
jgi:hypothetical protein